MVLCLYSMNWIVAWNECVQEEKLEPHSDITKCCALVGPDLLSVVMWSMHLSSNFSFFSFLGQAELVTWAVLWSRAMIEWYVRNSSKLYEDRFVSVCQLIRCKSILQLLWQSRWQASNPHDTMHAGQQRFFECPLELKKKSKVVHFIGTQVRSSRFC